MKKFSYAFVALFLTVALVAPAVADTIRLKDGSIIRGQVIGFRDQQFTVLIGAGAKGRRGRTTVYVEDIESIEFDSATTAAAAALANEDPATTNREPAPQPAKTIPARAEPSSRGINTNPNSESKAGSPLFFTVKVAVASDSKNNGWTNSALVVRRGQRLRITATGRISLGLGRFSTPAGVSVSNISSTDKLINTEPVGALIAVIGDDDNNFFVIGNRREFVAQRDGVLFLGVNDTEEGLADNTGSYDVSIEVEAGSPKPTN